MADREYYFDKKGKPITEFAVLKVFHFIGARRRREYMYKHVRIHENGYWIAQHLDGGTGSYWLKSVADCDGTIHDAEIVQEITRP